MNLENFLKNSVLPEMQVTSLYFKPNIPQDKLVNAIKAVGKIGGYVYIMDVSAGIPYISDTLSKDVTADVKAQLNKLK